LNTISAHLCAAQTKLREIQKEAADKRTAHLDELAAATATTKDNQWKKLILGLKHAEELCKCYAMVRQVAKPKQLGGITHVNVLRPDNDEATQGPKWDTVYKPPKIEKLVLAQHKKHFSQAHGTDFMMEPLRSLINDKFTSKFATKILEGMANINNLPIQELTKTLLRHLKWKTTTDEKTDHPIDTNAMIQGFKKWPERASTSPSGHHLRVYKSLAKDFPPPKDPSNQHEETIPTHPLQSGSDILILLIMMMNLAVQHTHTCKQWKIIWTLLLEKDPGNPQIDCLHTIHLYKADYNLLLKWFSSKGFMICSETKHCITDHQGGGCPGCSAIDLAITKVLSYELADSLHL